jgi:hypothetical protein
MNAHPDSHLGRDPSAATADTPPGVAGALRAALRDVNAAYNELPPHIAQGIEIACEGLDRELDAALVSGDHGRALTAIRAWRGHWLAEFEQAATRRSA